MSSVKTTTMIFGAYLGVDFLSFFLSMFLCSFSFLTRLINARPPPAPIYVNYYVLLPLYIAVDNSYSIYDRVSKPHTEPNVFARREKDMRSFVNFCCFNILHSQQYEKVSLKFEDIYTCHLFHGRLKALKDLD